MGPTFPPIPPFTLPTGPNNFIWGEETIIWVDSIAPGQRDGTLSNPFNSLQAAIIAATTNPLATTLGMRARLIILIAANSIFDEDIMITSIRILGEDRMERNKKMERQYMREGQPRYM